MGWEDMQRRMPWVMLSRIDNAPILERLALLSKEEAKRDVEKTLNCCGRISFNHHAF